ncbi:MAG: tRNA (adenosine(37)-N6)-dimethylallyltransferase MiaA [Pseudomonadota bacterium]
MLQKGDVIFLMGPTASGKTSLAMALSKQLPIEIISVDSALVYKGLVIGAAKPTTQELLEYPHHLIDIRDVTEPYSAANFREDAEKLIIEILGKGKIPLLVGGTMLYFKALLSGLADLPAADPSVRQQLDEEAKIHGLAYMHQQLEKVDPESAKRIHPNDPQRMLRALEVFKVSGKSLTQHREMQKTIAFPYNVIQLAIAPKERSELHQRIEARFDGMINEGFVEEVRHFWQREDVDESLPAMKSVGYRQIWQYLDGDLSFNEMQKRAVVASRQLAKRQLTWLRSWPHVHWLDSLDQKVVDKALNLINANRM